MVSLFFPIFWLNDFAMLVIIMRYFLLLCTASGRSILYNSLEHWLFFFIIFSLTLFIVNGNMALILTPLYASFISVMPIRSFFVHL